MKHFDSVRGRKPTKTELILEHLLKHPNEVLTPKEVAEDLDFNLQTTVTVLNRLALEGAITKKGRGQFCYEGKNILKDKESQTAPTREFKSQIDRKTAATIYNAIYNMASESCPVNVIEAVTGFGSEDFDENAPVESIQKLVRALMDLLGREIADDIVNIALENEANANITSEIMNILESEKV
jgi:DNA-binding transcriptional regulator YhcF (GntR family)